jgi:hypothetical protein
MAASGVVIPVPIQRREERRRSERYVAAMPVAVDGAQAVTQDLSSTGLAFTSDRPYEVGTHVEVVIEYILDGHHYPLRCAAEVVRVQPQAAGFTIGARLLPHETLQDISVGSATQRSSFLRSVP